MKVWHVPDGQEQEWELNCAVQALKWLLLCRCHWLSVNLVRRPTSRWGWLLAVSLAVCCCWLSSWDCCGRWESQLCVRRFCLVFFFFFPPQIWYPWLCLPHSLASSRGSTSSFSGRRMTRGRAARTWTRCCEPTGKVAKATSDQTLEVLTRESRSLCGHLGIVDCLFFLKGSDTLCGNIRACGLHGLVFYALTLNICKTLFLKIQCWQYELNVSSFDDTGVEVLPHFRLQ